jgi:hypothetical protein
MFFQTKGTAMLDLFRQSIANQYSAAIKMLENSIGRCDEQNWVGQVGKVAFWHVSYRAVLPDMYLSASEAEFRPQAFHHKNITFWAGPWRVAEGGGRSGVR